MPTVGEQLKAAREAQRLTVAQVAEITKIRSDHIRAIDAGNYDMLAAPVYIKGFVRTYATALKLDPQPIMTQLNHELAAAGGAQTPSYESTAPGFLDKLMFFLSTTGRRSLLSIAVLLVICGAAVGSLFLWREPKTVDPLKGLSPGLYQPPTPPPGETLPLPLPPHHS